MDLKEILKKNRFIVVWVGAGIFVLLYLFFVIRPVGVRLGRLTSQVSRKRSDFTATQNLISRKAEFENELKRIKARFTRIQGAMFSEEETTLFLKRLFLLAKETKIKILRANPVNGSGLGEISGYTEIPISLDIRAGYHPLGLFLSKLENSDFPLRAAELRIESIPETPYVHKVKMKIVALALKQSQVTR